MNNINNKFLNRTLYRALYVVALSSLSFSAIAAVAAGEEKFPDLKSSYLKTGNFVGPDHVKRIVTGLNKDQVRLQLGNPQFSEGLFGVKTWDYAFNFYTGQGDEFVTCQYKVKFDDHYLVKSTHWKDNQCESYINPPPAKAVAEAPTPAPVIIAAPVVVPAAKQLTTLDADSLFAFGKSSIDDVVSPSREKLADLVSQIKQMGAELSMITVTGYTDNIGAQTANLTLSQARANAIRTYLVQQGINGKIIRAYGAGETGAVAECAGKRVTPKLVECLQPNRRVEIELF